MTNGNVFVGILIGLIAAFCYNKFSETELPVALSFFSGKRLVPIMTAFFCTFLAIVLLLYGHQYLMQLLLLVNG